MPFEHLPPSSSDGLLLGDRALVPDLSKFKSVPGSEELTRISPSLPREEKVIGCLTLSPHGLFKLTTEEIAGVREIFCTDVIKFREGLPLDKESLLKLCDVLGKIEVTAKVTLTIPDSEPGQAEGALSNQRIFSPKKKKGRGSNSTTEQTTPCLSLTLLHVLPARAGRNWTECKTSQITLMHGSVGISGDGEATFTRTGYSRPYLSPVNLLDFFSFATPADREQGTSIRPGDTIVSFFEVERATGNISPIAPLIKVGEGSSQHHMITNAISGAYRQLRAASAVFQNSHGSESDRLIAAETIAQKLQVLAWIDSPRSHAVAAIVLKKLNQSGDDILAFIESIEVGSVSPTLALAKALLTTPASAPARDGFNDLHPAERFPPSSNPRGHTILSLAQAVRKLLT